MENGESGNNEVEGLSKSGRKQSAIFSFFLFLLILGWEGPLGLYMGLRDGDAGLIIAGLFITVFLWGLGIEEIKDFVKDIRRK